MSKAVPLHAMEAPVGDWKYSSYSFLTSALDVQIYSWEASICSAVPEMSSFTEPEGSCSCSQSACYCCLGLACDLLYLPLKFSWVFSLLHVCCMPCSSSHICFYHPNSIWWFVALCYMKESSRSKNTDYSYPIVLQLKLATLYWNNILALNYDSTQILPILNLASVSRAALRPT
jgi:hypothetical protein